MPKTQVTPPLWRLIIGFTVAPAVAALAFACVVPFYEGLPDQLERICLSFQADVIVGGYLPALVIGLPTLMFLRRRVQATLLNCALAGAFVAALPWAILCLLPVAQFASIDDKPTVINGVPTLFGLFETAKLIGQIAAFGLLGGCAFWAIVAAKPPSLPRVN